MIIFPLYTVFIVVFLHFSGESIFSKYLPNSEFHALKSECCEFFAYLLKIATDTLGSCVCNYNNFRILLMCE
jgi:hypothetical protein